MVQRPAVIVSLNFKFSSDLNHSSSPLHFPKKFLKPGRHLRIIRPPPQPPLTLTLPAQIRDVFTQTGFCDASEVGAAGCACYFF
jgi:hypothetical protein